MLKTEQRIECKLAGSTCPPLLPRYVVAVSCERTVTFLNPWLTAVFLYTLCSHWRRRRFTDQSLHYQQNADRQHFQPERALKSNIAKILKSLFRPPWTVVPGKPYVLQQFFFIFSSRDLLGSWTDLREILPQVRKHVQFITAALKLWGLPQKNFGAKIHAKFSAILDTFPLWAQLSHVQQKARRTLVH